MASVIPNRSENDLKNKWNSMKRKEMRKFQVKEKKSLNSSMAKPCVSKKTKINSENELTEASNLST